MPIGRRVLVGLLVLLAAAYIAWPLGVLGIDALSVHDARGARTGATAANLAGLFGGEALAATWTSLWTSLVSVLLAALIGIPLAVALFAWRLPLRVWLLVGAVAPLTLPPIVGMFAFYLLIGDIGLIPERLGEWFGDGRPLGAVMGIPGVLLVHGYSFSVYFTLLVGAALRRADPSLVEAARVHGASRWYAFRRALLPGLAPAIAAAAAISFMTAMGSFSAPYILANGEPFLAVLIYELTFAEGVYQPAFGLAAALSCLAAGICVAALLVARRFDRSAAAQRGARAATPARPRGAGAWIAGGCCALGGTILLLPQLCIAVISLSDFVRWTDGLLPPGWTLDHYASLGSAWRPVRNSALAAGLATAVCLAVGLLAARTLGRERFRGRDLLDGALMLPLALPGSVVAFALLRAFSVATPQTLGVALAQTAWLLPVAWAIRCLPLAVRPLVAAAQGADPSHEEAARVHGGRPWYVYRRVVLPHLWPTIAAAGLVVFITAAGEFVAALMVSRPDNMPLGVYIYQRLQSGIPAAAAASTLLMLLTVAVGVARWLLLRRRAA